MIFKRSPKEGKVKAEVHINYGNDRVSISEAIVDPGTSVLEILKMVSDIRYTPDESATGHCGAMVTAIDGFKNDLFHFWMYYLREESDSGWRLPMDTPDAVLINRNSRIAWRYHEAPMRGQNRSGVQIFGPLFSKGCISRIKKCNRQF